jgi:putative transposase
MCLIAGRTAQTYNRRKNRRGAFWEDRYHAVPVKKQAHLIECLVYVDLNMVRAGVVNHPAEWPHAGYNEIQKPRKRYVIIDHDRLLAATGLGSFAALQRHHAVWVRDKLNSGSLSREDRWTQGDAATDSA